MAITHGSATRDDLAQKVATLTAAGLLQIFDVSAVKLVEFDMNGWGTVANAQVTANAITDQGAIVGGVADNYVITEVDGVTAAVIGDVGDLASGTGLVIDNLNIGAADVVSVTSLIYTAAI